MVTRSVMQTYWNAVRSFNRSIRLYFVMWSLLALANFGIINVLQNLYLLRLGLDVESIGNLIGFGQLMWAVGALPGAAIGRRIGPRCAITTGIAMNLIAFTMFFSVEAMPASMWPAWLWFWNTFNWIGSAIFVVNSTPYIIGISKPEERSYVFAVQSAIFPAFAFVGSLFAGLLPGLFASAMGLSLDEPAPYRNGLLIVPLLYVLMLVVFSRTKASEISTQEPMIHSSGKAPIATLLVFGLIGVLQAVGDGAILSFFTIYLDQGLGMLPAQIGALIGAASLLPIAGALLSAPLMRRLGSGATFGWASSGLGAALVMMGLLPTVIATAISRMLAGSMLSIGGASRNLFSQEIVAMNWRTWSSAVSTVGMALGWTLAAFAGGVIIRNAGFGTLFMLAGAMAWLSAVLTFIFLRVRKMQQQAPAHASLIKDSPS
jgi:MFS family permease